MDKYRTFTGSATHVQFGVSSFVRQKIIRAEQTIRTVNIPLVNTTTKYKTKLVNELATLDKL